MYVDVKKLIHSSRFVVADSDLSQYRIHSSNRHGVGRVTVCAEVLNAGSIEELEVTGIEHNALGVNLTKANPVGVPTPISHARSLSRMGGAR